MFIRKPTFLSSLLVSILLISAAGAAVTEDDTANQPGMSMVQAIVLGVVEGLTEYLPVSSTGHLLLAERIMGIGETTALSPDERQRDKEAADAYAICIQAGAIIAVLGLYFRRVRLMLQGLLGRSRPGLQLLINVTVGFLPAAVIGLLFNSTIKAYLFGPWPVVAAWLAGGLAILAVASRGSKTGLSRESAATLENMTWKMAVMIGFAQCIAMWPGVSRSLVTIVGGLLVGLSMSAAVEYSFLLGVLTLGAATAYDALKHGEVMLQIFDPQSLAIGLLFAFIAAVISVKWMVAYLNSHSLAIFGYYRVALALVTAVLLGTDVI